MKEQENKSVELIDLYHRLREYWTEENLHAISTRIIQLQREKRYEGIRYLSRISGLDEANSGEKDSKTFSALIMRYHPDKLHQQLKAIEYHYLQRDLERLNEFSHIIRVLKDYQRDFPITVIESVRQFEEEYDYDFGGGEYGIFDDAVPEEQEEYDPWASSYDAEDNSFFAAVKRKIYGDRIIDLPGTMLEDLEEIEMAEYEIDDLDGIEWCRYAVIVDLSRNRISDLGPLSALNHIEELYLSENEIGYLDQLVQLSKLRVLDISFNEIDDLSPLFDLPELSYLNIMGNPVPEHQLETLREMGVLVIK